MDNFEIVIVSADGKPRNTRLVALFPEAFILKGHDGRNRDYEIPSRIQQNANKILYGRAFTAPQAAAVMSHYAAQIQGKAEWTCLLEDDAVIPDKSQFFHAIDALTTYKTTKPLLFLLYTGHRGVYKAPIRITELFSILPVISMPEGAVGYLINSALREVIRKQATIIGPPDWPTWTSQAKSFALIPPVVNASSSFKSIYMHKYGSVDRTKGINESLSAGNWYAGYSRLLKPRDIACFGGYRLYFASVLRSQFRRHLAYKLSRIRLRKLRRS